MKLVVQRVKNANVSIENNIVGKRKVFLMMKGLQKIKEEKKDISQNIFLLGGKYSEVSEEIKKSLPKMII